MVSINASPAAAEIAATAGLDRGKSDQSPAHMAKEIHDPANGPFGQLVRQFAQGTPPAPPVATAAAIEETAIAVEHPVTPPDSTVEGPAVTLDAALIAEAILAETLLTDEDEEEITTA